MASLVCSMYWNGTAICGLNGPTKMSCAPRCDTARRTRRSRIGACSAVTAPKTTMSDASSMSVSVAPKRAGDANFCERTR